MGYGVPRNHGEMIRYYRLAADQGDPTAQCNLANCYENGIGIAGSLEEAKKWYRVANAQGNSRAVERLSMM